MPPPRAVSEGTKGASTTPAAAIEYPSVSGLRPNCRTKTYATRIPKPVDVTARAKRNAVNMSDDDVRESGEHGGRCQGTGESEERHRHEHADAHRHRLGDERDDGGDED